MSGRRIDVLHIGSASRDLTPDDPRGWRLGGGVTYAALTTARLGLRTAAYIGVDEAADWATAIPDDALVAVGWQGFLRELAEGREVGRRAPGPSAVVGRGDLVGVSQQDLEPGTRVATLATFLRPGADLLVTQGSRGG